MEEGQRGQEERSTPEGRGFHEEQVEAEGAGKGQGETQRECVGGYGGERLGLAGEILLLEHVPSGARREAVLRQSRKLPRLADAPVVDLSKSIRACVASGAGRPRDICISLHGRAMRRPVVLC